MSVTRVRLTRVGRVSVTRESVTRVQTIGGATERVRCERCERERERGRERD